jgi:hypothetical protein
MSSEVIVGWNQHLKNGNVWKVQVELPMQDTPGDDIYYYSVDLYVVAPNSNLAQYIATTMYPEYDSICVDDNPVSSAP